MDSRSPDVRTTRMPRGGDKNALSRVTDARSQSSHVYDNADNKTTVNYWECGRLFCKVKDRRPVRTVVVKRSAYYLPDNYSLGVITSYCDNPPVNGLKPQMCPWWAKNPGPY